MMYGIPSIEANWMHMGFPTLFEVWNIAACEFLEERIIHGWLHKHDGLDHGLTKFDGGSPSDRGATRSCN